MLYATQNDMDQGMLAALSMQDDLGIIYLIETAQQFWSELEDILKLPSDDAPTLSLLDSTLRRFIVLCASYHEQYLQSPLQLEHACNLILDSELFEFHSERMCEIIVDDTRSTTDPHMQLISYHILLFYGRRRSDFFRAHKRWLPLIPLLMDHVLVEIDPDVEDTYFGTAMGSNPGQISVPVPIEAKLRSLGVKLLYEVCRVQKLSVQDLRVFDDPYIDYLFDLVEQTRYMQDETFNYSVIKLIVSLNEQFMVASLGHESAQLESTNNGTGAPDTKNRVVRVLMRRLGSSQTFGENMIFMLNRAKRTPEDQCMQLLILKILYVLFTTKGTSDFFYTNDLCVLVDVFLRELIDLDEDSESLRHTYLRVLHPLLTKTQLKDIPYKRPQVLYALEALVGNAPIRDVNPTTKRLVDRCLSGDWCVQLRAAGTNEKRHGSSSSIASTIPSPTSKTGPSSAVASQQLEPSSTKKSLKFSKSVENLTRSAQEQQHPRSPLDKIRRPSNASTLSLPGIATTTANPKVVPPVPNPKRRGTSESEPNTGHHSGSRVNDSEHNFHQHHHQLLAPASTQIAPKPDGELIVAKHRRPPPPAPPKRRKPPAIPVTRITNGGVTITTIRTSATSPLAQVS